MYKRANHMQGEIFEKNTVDNCGCLKSNLAGFFEPVQLRVAIITIGLVLCGSVKAGQYSLSFTNGNTIPDANPTGLTDTRAISGIPAGEIISRVEVGLDISGGYNGDLYAYLRHESGTNIGFSVLLNRVGKSSNNPGDGELYFGYPDTGFVVTLSDSASADIHVYRSGSYMTNEQGQLLGTWQPDARNVNPYVVVTSDLRSAYLDSFAGLDPNGEWTLFIADCSSGEIAMLQTWSLNILTVPEPSPIALVALGTVGTAIWFPSVRRRVTTGLRTIFTNTKS